MTDTPGRDVMPAGPAQSEPGGDEATPLPWKVLRSDVVRKDRWIDLRAEACRTPGGAVLDPYYVLKLPEWVCAVAVTPDRQLVLVRLYRHGFGAAQLELPGGIVEAGETNVGEAARRELLEETGYAGDAPQRVSAIPVNPATHSNCLHTYLITNARRIASPRHDEGEAGLQVVVMPAQSVLDHLHEGMLGHAPQVGSLVLALRHAGLLSLRAEA